MTVHDIRAEEKPPSMCVVIYEGEETEITISGIYALTGSATITRKGISSRDVQVFLRFIGKTFWQQVGRESRYETLDQRRAS